MIFKWVVALGLTCAVGAGSARAAVITGTLNFSGAAAVGENSVDFYAPGGGTGTVSADSFTQTWSFAAVAGTPGTIVDLGLLTPGAANIPKFLMFASAPGIEIDLTGIDEGVFTSTALAAAPAAGQTATPTGSAYNMTNLALPASVLSWEVTANAVDTGTGDVTPMTGVFTMQFPTQTIQDVAGVWAAQGVETASFSATFTTVPEPAGLGLLALGAVGLLGRRRRG